MQSGRAFLALWVVCSFSVAFSSTTTQDRRNPQTRPAPGGQQGGRPQVGGGSGGGRPTPGRGGNRPNPSTPNPERPNPGRPNPGNGDNRPGRPNPGGGNNRPQPGRPGNGSRPPNRPGPGRPPQWGRPPANRPSYHFRPHDRSYLHRYYMHALLGINRANRPHFVIGGFFPYGSIPYITPLPPHVCGYLPTPPPGYQMGYYDGYVVIYDPLTYFIANVVDLLH